MAAEKSFENQVKNFLKEQDAWFVKYWGGAAYTTAGVPDLLICCNGYFVGVEVKAPKGVPTDLQIYNLREIDYSGGYAILLYPGQFEEFKMFIKCLNADNLSLAEHYYEQLKVRWVRRAGITFKS